MSTKSAKELHVYICQVRPVGPPLSGGNEGLYPFLPSARRFFSPPLPLPPPRARAREARSEGSSSECVRSLLNASPPCAPREREPWVGQPAAHGNPRRPRVPQQTPPWLRARLTESSTAASSFSLSPSSSRFLPPRDDPFPSHRILPSSFFFFFATAGPYGCFD